MANNSDSSRWSGKRERRRFGRFATQLLVATSRDDLVARGETRRAAQCQLQLQDFSLGGLRASSAVPLKANERLTLRMPASGTHPILEVTGRVIHCTRQAKRYQVGIVFCQTRQEPFASPYRQLPRLFSLAASYSGGSQAAQARQDS